MLRRDGPALPVFREQMDCRTRTTFGSALRRAMEEMLNRGSRPRAVRSSIWAISRPSILRSSPIRPSGGMAGLAGKEAMRLGLRRRARAGTAATPDRPGAEPFFPWAARDCTDVDSSLTQRWPVRQVSMEVRDRIQRTLICQTRFRGKPGWQRMLTAARSPRRSSPRKSASSATGAGGADGRS